MIAPLRQDRCALYALQASAGALAVCARFAEDADLRVVTIVDEGVPGGTPLSGQSLDRLVDRLAAGEFELIVAHTGEGRLLTLQAALDTAAKPDVTRCPVYPRCTDRVDPNFVTRKVHL